MAPVSRNRASFASPEEAKRACWFDCYGIPIAAAVDKKRALEMPAFGQKRTLIEQSRRHEWAQIFLNLLLRLKREVSDDKIARW